MSNNELMSSEEYTREMKKKYARAGLHIIFLSQDEGATTAVKGIIETLDTDKGEIYVRTEDNGIVTYPLYGNWGINREINLA